LNTPTFEVTDVPIALQAGGKNRGEEVPTWLVHIQDASLMGDLVQ
jgi:hypothetical protein